METKNYDWKNIVFEIRDMIVANGHNELFHISNVVETSEFDHFASFKVKRNKSNEYETIIIPIPQFPGYKKVNVEFRPYKKGFATSVVLIPDRFDEGENNLIGFIIDRWRIKLKKNFIDIKHIEELQKLYRENDINIRFVISIMHEIGHSFENYKTLKYTYKYLDSKQLNPNEYNYYYHQRPDETAADVLAIETLYRHGEEILNIILKNKKILLTMT